jgi:DnaJ family protein C protein 2
MADVAAADDEKAQQKEFKEKFRTHKVAADTVDHYEALGLAHERYTATPQMIRTAYRKMSLQYHPDKMGHAEGDGEAGHAQYDDSVFKRIAKAYEVLSDPQKRREYDSQEDFDDRIPDGSVAQASEAEFFAVYTPVFDRNARFSIAKVIPRLGDMDTPMDEVDEFYRFWHGFQSWREFPLEDAYDPEEASSREERRWIERKNERR